MSTNSFLTTIQGVDYLLTPFVKEKSGQADMHTMFRTFQDTLENAVHEDRDNSAAIERELNQALLQDFPRQSSVSTKGLVNSICRTRQKSGAWTMPVTDAQGNIVGSRPMTFDEEEADRARVTDLLVEYLRDHRDRFKVARGAGVTVRYVPGEQDVDEEGNVIVDASGAPVAFVRVSDSDWGASTSAPSSPPPAKSSPSGEYKLGAAVATTVAQASKKTG